MCKVSVLMPVYNAEKYLAKAIDSIISQTFEDWELLLINDGSTDTSKSIIDGYTDNRIRVIENENNMGLIKTLNKGIELCKGKYIARMDADDISHPKRLALQVDFLEKNKDYILCGTNAEVINNDGITTGKVMNPSSNTLLQISLLFTNPFVHPSMMLKTNVLQSNHFDTTAIHVEDYELWTRLAPKGLIANIEEPLLKYRWHDSNVSVKHAETQENAKNKIIKKQLLKLNLKPTDSQLHWHRYTFMLYTLGQKNEIKLNDCFTAVGDWFSILKKKNRELNIFPKSDFESFLWSRWIVLSISKKKKLKALFPPFITPSPSVIYKILKLLNYLRKK